MTNTLKTANGLTMILPPTGYQVITEGIVQQGDKVYSLWTKNSTVSDGSQGVWRTLPKNQAGKTVQTFHGIARKI